MKVVVMGASGTMGRLVVEGLAGRGIDVVAAHRGAGVDALSGVGLAGAVEGAEVVVDCLNVSTQSGRKATDFFIATAGNIAYAAQRSGARVVCLSICNAVDPSVNAAMGYYRGKAAQEATYREHLGDRLTVVRTTQWFELAETLSGQFSVGPVAAMPRMVTAPLAAADGADVIAANVVEPAGAVVDVCGPQRHDLVEVARALWAHRGRRGVVIPLRFGGPALRNGALIPERPDVVTATTLDQWLAQQPVG